MVVNVRVELSDSVGKSRDDKERAFKNMLNAFNKQVKNESNIIALWKEKQYFESKSEKKRRKRKKNELERRKAKLREYFG